LRQPPAEIILFAGDPSRVVSRLRFAFPLSMNDIRMKTTPLFAACVAAALLVCETGHVNFATADEGAVPTISTFAGSGEPSTSSTPKRAALLEFAVDNPFGIEPYSPGTYYACEFGGHRILKLDLNEGFVEVVGGDHHARLAGDGGPATKASFNAPHEIRRDSEGALYVADSFNHVVRKLDPKTGAVTTIAGTGEANFSGDGGPADQAAMNGPISIALDGKGNLYVADIGNHRIRQVDLATGIITTVAGTGEKQLPRQGGRAKDNPVVGPRSLFYQDGLLYVALREGNSVWSLDPQTDRWTHLAGSGKKGYSGDGGDPLQATFDGPKGIVVAESGPDGKPGKIYVADTENHAIRVIDRNAATIATLAGQGPKHGTFGGDGGPASESSLKRPHGICLTPEGDLFIGDSENHRFRKIDLP
jgi:streptogramin lyase